MSSTQLHWRIARRPSATVFAERFSRHLGGVLDAFGIADCDAAGTEGRNPGGSICSAGACKCGGSACSELTLSALSGYQGFTLAAEINAALASAKDLSADLRFGVRSNCSS